MQEDFFAELGETLSKTARDIGSRADSFFESQKIRTKIISEQRMIDKSMEDIGNIIYKKYVDGHPMDEDVAELCEDITQRKSAIANYRETISRMKGQRVCAACGASVPAEAAFCMQCGAPCTAEEEPEASPMSEEMAQDVQREEEEAESQE